VNTSVVARQPDADTKLALVAAAANGGAGRGGYSGNPARGGPNGSGFTGLAALRHRGSLPVAGRAGDGTARALRRARLSPARATRHCPIWHLDRAPELGAGPHPGQPRRAYLRELPLADHAGRRRSRPRAANLAPYPGRAADHRRRGAGARGQGGPARRGARLGRRAGRAGGGLVRCRVQRPLPALP